jgi:drug/metabolite transporter (DMT)-like permease
LVVAVAALLGPLVAATLSSAQLLLIPGELLGRTSAASAFLSSALQPLAPLAAGLVVEYLSRTAAQYVLAGAFVLVAVVSATMPGLLVTDPDDPDVESGAATPAVAGRSGSP